MKGIKHPIFRRVAQALLGIPLLLAGLNKFFEFYDPNNAELLAEVINSLVATGYLIPFIAAVEIAGGLLLLVNRFVGLALIILFPITINIFLVHAVWDPATVALGAILLVLNVVLMISYYEKHYRQLLQPS